MNSSIKSTALWQKLLTVFGFALLSYGSFSVAAEAATIVQSGTYNAASPIPSCAIPAGGAAGRILVSWPSNDIDGAFAASDPINLCDGGGCGPGQNSAQWRSTNPVATSIPAGNYRITVHTYDGNSTRLAANSGPQLDESIRIHLFSNGAGSGASFARTDRTDDLSDAFQMIGQTDVVESNFNISQAVQSIRGIHVDPDTVERTKVWDSTRVRCVAFDPISAPTVNLIVSNPGPVAPGSNVTLTWTTTGNPTSCTASGGWSGAKAVPSGSQSVSVPANRTFTINCTGPGGSSSDFVTVTTSQPLPTVNLTANPAGPVAPGTPVTLTWTTTNASTCTASGGWSGAKAVPSGSQSVTVTANTTYTITCANISGSTPDSVTVNVTAPPPGAPTVNLNANPSTVDAGDPSIITWTSTNATNCTSGSGWTGSGTSNAAGVTVNPAVTTTYTITCTGPGGSTPDSVTVTVNSAPPPPPPPPPPTPPSVTLTITDPSDGPGDGVDLEWDGENVTSCTLTGGGVNVSGGGDGSATVNPNTDTTYTVNCTGPVGPASDDVFVNVLSPNDLAGSMILDADPIVIRRLDTTELTWSFDPLFLDPAVSTGCHIVGGSWNSGPLTSASGSMDSGPLSSETTFTLQCGGVTAPPATASVRVRVIPEIVES